MTEIAKKVITQVQQNKDYYSENIAEIGAMSDYVYIPTEEKNSTTPNEKTHITLTNFFKYVKDFFTNGIFIAWGPTSPKNTQVKIWYETPQSTNN